MQEERERQEHGNQEGSGEEKSSVQWQVGGAAVDDFEIAAGTKLADFLKERGHKNLKNKHLFLNGTQLKVDEDGNLIDDIELHDGDILSLFEGQITKGKS